MYQSVASYGKTKRCNCIYCWSCNKRRNGGRITSYNVCYTKLLRVVAARVGGMVAPALATEVGLGEAVALQLGAHRAVDDDDVV